MEANRIAEIGRSVSSVFPPLGRQLVDVSAKLQSGALEKNEASLLLLKAIDAEVRRVRAYEQTGHSAALIQQLHDIRVKIAKKACSDAWRKAFPDLVKKWTEAAKDTRVARTILRIVKYAIPEGKEKWVCRIAGPVIHGAEFVRKVFSDSEARKKAVDALRQTREVAKGYAMKFCETAKAVAHAGAVRVKMTMASVAHKTESAIRASWAAVKKSGSWIKNMGSSVLRSLAAIF